MRFGRWAGLTMLISLFALAGCGCEDLHGGDPEPPPAEEPDQEPEPADDVLSRLEADPGYSAFVSYIDRVGFADELRNGAPRTVFAPTNDALRTVPGRCLNTLRDDDLLLARFVRQHFGSGLGALTEEQLRRQDGRRMAVETGESVAISVDGGLTVDGIPVQQVDHRPEGTIVRLSDGALVPAEPAIPNCAPAG